MFCKDGAARRGGGGSVEMRRGGTCVRCGVRCSSYAAWAVGARAMLDTRVTTGATLVPGRVV